MLPAVSALFLAFSFPPFHPLLLPFVGLVPFALFVHGLAPDSDGRLAAVRGSLMFGLIYFGVLFYWILVALIWFTKMAILAYVGSMALLVGAAALLGWMLHRAIHEVRAPMWLALPVTWTAVEWFRSHWPGPLAFPWLGLGSSLTGYPELVGMAELVGSRGVTFWIVLVNGLITTAMIRHRAGRPRARLVLALGAVLLLPPAWGVWRAGSLQLREVGRVAVVQPNVPEHIKLDNSSALDSTFASLERLLPRIEPGSVMLVALPEVTFPIYARADYAVGPMARLQDYAREVGAPILFGGLGFTGDVYADHVPFNSVFLMEPQGLTDYQYDKRYLVPMVERVPLVPEDWLRGLKYFGKFGVGAGWPLAWVDEAAFGALVCYESSYPEASRRFRLEGGDVLVNVTNDAWYGREPWYSRTTALWQHPAHMVMRAIENRMGVARAANTGISLFVDPVGRVYNATRLFEADVRAEMVYTTEVLTFYTRFGDLVGNGSAVAALILVLAASRLRRRYPSLDPTAGRN
jgi:apolipoprotein N-acyltransferase